MKKLLLFLTIVIAAFVASPAAKAETLNFKATNYTIKTMKNGTWSNWSSWEKCNVKISMNLDTDVVTIYSDKKQVYYVNDYDEPFKEDGATQINYHFRDQDGDKGTMTLVMRDNGRSEIYIRFANVQWGYIVVRTN